MKKFNSFAEALMVTTEKPESDSIGSVSGGCCDNNKDMLTKSVEDALGGLGGAVQPDDGIGEYGELEDDMEPSEGGEVEFECLGEDGLIVKFSGIAILLPVNVIDAIRSYEPEESEESDNDEESEESDNDEESNESEESEESDNEEESDNDEDDEDDVFKSTVTNVN